ncbi:helix-turn-helix domain-containing protein [Amycolatopsis sp. cmx-4-61]|uniref:helix-turn-helix domain-containing protein n=1 Tax=Amycolatopsis sp. cmx-4-61 TaxID=2790937 RepID=UPI00397982FD
MVVEPTSEDIGKNLLAFRHRRGLSQDQVGSAAGISRTYVSHLESGRRSFEKRGLLERLAQALSCSVTDLTGQPYPAGTKDTAEARAAIPPISRALAEATLDDVPDFSARPIDQLVKLTRVANAASANSDYTVAGHELAQLLVELHVHAVTGTGATPRRALAALTEACVVALGTARNFGHLDLAITVGERAREAAARLESPVLGGFSTMSHAIVLGRIGAHHRAERVTHTALADLGAVDPDAEDTAPAEAAGMLHLARAQLAAKQQNPDADAAMTHIAEASALAARTGERRTLHYDFGPANTQAWKLSLAVELGRGPEMAERITRRSHYEAGLVSADRLAALHFDLARAFSQAGGKRDDKALWHLDRADQTAPQRIRHDPVAREVLNALDRRAQHREWRLKSLKNRIPAG